MLLIRQYFLRSLLLLPALLSLFLTIVAQPVSAQALNVQVPDAQLQNCLTELAQKHQWTSADAVTEISCHNKKIRSLTGIEQFANLGKASFHNNNVDQLNLSGLQKLRHLNLSRNSLRQIELANLPALEELYLFRNQIQKLHLSKLPALKLLKANSSSMKEFTYEQLPALEKIYLFDNKLKHMDIYNLPAMQYLDARQNPMSDQLYDEMDLMSGVTILHDGNADDW